MPVGLTIEVLAGGDEGEVAVERMAVAFERFGVELADFGKRAFPALVPVFEAETDRRFDARGGPSGAWPQLSVRYASWKAKHFPGAPLMERSGSLRAALTNSGSPEALRDYTAAEFNYGTRGLPYASAHQLGAGRLPVRRLFDFGQQFEADLVRAASGAVRQAAVDSDLERFVTWEEA